MKNFSLFLIFLLSGSFLFAQKTPNTEANYKGAARYSPEKLKNMVFSTDVDPHWLKSGDKFWYNYRTSNGETYWVVNLKTRTKSTLFDNEKMAEDLSLLTGDPFDAQHLSITNLEFINNDTQLRFEVKSTLVEEEVKEDGDTQEKNGKKNGKPKMEAKTWYFIYTLANRQLQLLSDYEKPKDNAKWAAIAPNKEYVIFARNHNLMYMNWEDYQKALKNEKDSTIQEHPLTEDGMEYYSYASNSWGETDDEKLKKKDERKAPVWIYFSPDSKYFAFERTDSRKVKELWVINSVANPRPTLETYKYQMPGESESPVSELVLFNFEQKEKKIIKTEGFVDQTINIYRSPLLKTQRDDKIKPMLWLSKASDKLYFSLESRDRKKMNIYVADVKTGETTLLIEEKLNTYLEIRAPQVQLVNNGSEIIHWSERNGWGHFYLYDGKGNFKNQITKGSFHCESIEAIDENNRVLYFRANGREKGEDPYYSHLYKVNFNGTGLTLLNPGNYDHQVSVNDNGSFFVDNFSRVNTTPSSYLKDSRGNKLIELETADLSKLFESGYKFPEPFTVKAADGITDLYGVMYKPFDFDSTKQYPLIEYVYPGPQTEAVNKSFSSRMDRLDRLAQFGFIVISVGNRGGHPGRSKWYHNYGYGNLRDYGLADKKYAAEQLADRFDYIDIDRVGIFGHSGGGFMSTAAMLVYPDFFKVAVSSSGNHDNKVYNRWWSETHHGVKETTDKDGNTSFVYDIDTNPELAKNLKGKLMITTGDIDNNVHPAGTIRVANALIKANKRFDFFIFPGQRHGYGNMSEYFFWLLGDYFCEHLLGEKANSTDIVEMNRDVPNKK